MRKRLTEHLANKSSAGLRREIMDDFKYDKKKIKHLQHVLHNVNVALGTLVSALNEFSRVKGPSISPDGLLGGLGYIMPLKGIKEVINTSIHNLSEVADSIADELTNPHWNAKDDKETKEVIKEKEKVEEEINESTEGVEQQSDQQPEMQEQEEETVGPKDVVTSKEFTASDIKLASAIKQALVKYNFIGKKST